MKMLKHQPKTLAKTLDYIARRSPGEHGLFWDPDGAMPWKEFYWVLQEDPSLRFVRESTIRELGLLGIDLPFLLDGNRLRLVPEIDKPEYPPASDVPERLYAGLSPKKMVHTQKNGLDSAGRKFLPLCSDRQLALRIAKRREQEPILIEVLAGEASGHGLSFFVAGPHLYLAESIPAQFIVFPKIRRDLAERLAQQVARRAEKPSPPPAPGSFTVQPHHLQASKPGGKETKKNTKAEWKKERRKERHKRDF
jgi:putative RNA 2'-phosphotransferase